MQNNIKYFLTAEAARKSYWEVLLNRDGSRRVWLYFFPPAF
jgi:hypothetical protein